VSITISIDSPAPLDGVARDIKSLHNILGLKSGESIQVKIYKVKTKNKEINVIFKVSSKMKGKAGFRLFKQQVLFYLEAITNRSTNPRTQTIFRKKNVES
jgi:hypothetical protein